MLCAITGWKATSVVIRPTAVWLVCAVAVVVVLPCWCVMAVLGFHMHCLGMGGKRPPPGEKNQLPPSSGTGSELRKELGMMILVIGLCTCSHPGARVTGPNYPNTLSARTGARAHGACATAGV